jgi:hypothetical protein
MDAHDALHRHREEAERVGLAQVRLGGEGKFRQVIERTAIVRLDARCVELPAVGRHVLVGVGERPAQPLQLQVLQLFARCLLDRLERKGPHLPW